MPILNVYIIICLSLALAYVIGLLTFLTDHEENKCEMTYMFQYPQFVQIITPYDYKFNKYGLYAYNEGHFTEKTRDMYFDGIPVLFIPGNAGSYKQARSLASVALRKALDSQYGYHFDYFTVDLHGELSGLNGVLLEEQSDYVNRSIYHILDLYKKRKYPPKSIILVGHSMGGVIAQHISATNEGLIPIIITLSSPITRPSIIFDYNMHKFYKNIEYSLNNTIIINLSGGFNDFLVPSYLTNGHGLNVVTTTIPKVWLPADHLCILWCKQLVLAINRALFESIDVKTKQISLDTTHISNVFYNHLVKNSGVKMKTLNNSNNIVPINNVGEWIEKLARKYTVRLLQGTKEQQWHMIPYVNQMKHECLSIVALNLEISDWIYACSASSVRGHSRVCVQAKHLSHISEIAPTTRYKRRNFHINIHQLKQTLTNWTHIVVKVPPTKEPVVLHFDVHSKQDRTINSNLPKLWSLTKKNIIKETADKAIFYELKFPDLRHIIQSFYLYLEPFNCQFETHHATASLMVPWSNENIHKYFTELDSKPLQVRLYSSKLPKYTNKTAVIKLTLDPTCKYRISIQLSWFGMLGNMARYYSPLLFANLVAVVLMTLRSQFNAIHTKGKCPLFFIAIKEGAKPYYVLTSAKLIAKLVGVKNLSKFLPISDWNILVDEGTDFLLLPLLLYLTSVGIIWILASVLSFVMVVCEATANKFVMKFISITLTGAMTWSEWVLNGLQKLPGIVAGILIVISFSTCGGLALGIGVIFYFFKLTKMSQDFIEDVMWKIAKNILSKIGRTFFKKKKVETKNVTILSVTDQKTENTEITNNKEENIKNTIELIPETKGEGDGRETEVANSETQYQNSTIENDRNESNLEDKLIKRTTDKNESNLEDKLIEKTNLKNDVIKTGNSPSEIKNERSLLEKLLENDEIFFHFSIFLLWSFVTLINIPVVLTWAHNYKYNKFVTHDPSFIPGAILSICALPLWQLEFPKTSRRGYKELGNAVFIVALIALVYCPISVYRLNYLLTGLIALIMLHQLLAPNKTNIQQINSENTDDTNIKTFFEKIKTKLE